MSINYIGSSRAVIDSPGDYTIDRDLTQPHPEKSCITINPGVHFVTLRLRSRLEGAGGLTSINSGIEANNSAALNIINDGGSVRGFGYGAKLYDCYRPRIIGLNVVDALFRGIKIEGNSAYVKDCDIRNIGGATWTPNAYCMGIEVQGIGAGNDGRPKVLDNCVENVAGVGTGESVGIAISDKAMNGMVCGNTVKNPAQIAGSFALWVGGASDVIATYNTFADYFYAMAFSTPPTGFEDNNTVVRCAHRLVDSNGDVISGGH